MVGELPELVVDPEWYLLAHPDVAAEPIGPEQHFAWYGDAEDRAPSPRFDPAAYLVATPVGVDGLDLGPDEITVAEDPDAFARAVVGLYVDRERREAQRRRAYDVARRRFTLDALVNRLGAALDDLRSG